MTRGRKKDLTIPPTRALVQQRDYRARKAQYVSELEERCARAEEENIQLRKDLAVVRSGSALPAAVFDPLTVCSSLKLPLDCLLIIILPADTSLFRTDAKPIHCIIVVGSLSTSGLFRFTSQ